MVPNKAFLDEAYTLGGADTTRTLYADWAASYEDEIRANGYATPARCAAALAEVAGDKGAPLLDLGCGTGLSGEAFAAAGFTLVDGSDFSPEMLARAESKSGLYRKLVQGDLNNPLPASPGEYAHIAAVGVFSPGHAPAAMIHAVMKVLPAGGCFVFSLNDHALEDVSYQASIDAVVAAGTAEIVFERYGDHLPGRGLEAMVYVLRRCEV